MESLIGRHRIYDGFKQYKMETTIKSCSFLCSFHSNYNYNRFGVVHSFNSILARNFSSLFAYAFVSSSIFSALHSSEQVTNKRTKWTSLLFMCIAHCDNHHGTHHNSLAENEFGIIIIIIMGLQWKKHSRFIASARIFCVQSRDLFRHFMSLWSQ